MSLLKSTACFQYSESLYKAIQLDETAKVPGAAKFPMCLSYISEALI